MHSPIIVSGLILLAMITTLVGAVHYEGGKISIEPNSSNLIIFNNPATIKQLMFEGLTLLLQITLKPQLLSTYRSYGYFGA